MKFTSKRNRRSWNCGNTAPHEYPSLRMFHLGSSSEHQWRGFPSINFTYSRLSFDGGYGSLEEREATELGHGALNDAIRNLFNEQLTFDSKKRALLVIVQMVSEAVRIKCHASSSTGLMLYQCNSKAIKMLVPVAVGAGEQCPDGESIVNIIKRDGKCVDVKDEQYNNGKPIILCPCENAKGNQLWIFKSNGTIRSNGKCLTTYGYASGNYLMIFDYDTTVPEAIKWILYNAGTIMNPRSGLFIAAETSTQGIVMTVAKDNNSFRLAWSAGNYTQPTINYISGFLKMCLQANGTNACVWLARLLDRSSNFNHNIREI
nr:type 2 ribosome-inactivating protein precursor [Tanacetum cinerariifolium]